MITSSLYISQIDWVDYTRDGDSTPTKNVIDNIGFGVTLTDSETGLKVTNTGLIGCRKPHSQDVPFTPASDLTKSQIIGWIYEDGDNIEYVYNQALRWLQNDIDALSEPAPPSGISLDQIPD